MTRMLDENETRRLIAAGKIGRLGCIDNGEPYVVPINYLFENMAIYSHSMPGRKIEASDAATSASRSATAASKCVV